MSITTNADQVNRELDSFVGAVLERVVPRSINELMRQAKTAGTREAARLYGMRVGDIAVSWHEDAAVRGELEASINAKGAESIAPALKR